MARETPAHENAPSPGRRSAGGRRRAPPRRQASERPVSHHDRDQTVEILRVAAGDGRLTSVESDERVEAALATRAVADPAALTVDSPLEGMQPKVPRRMEIRLMFSDLVLGFTEARLPRRTPWQWLRHGPRMSCPKRWPWQAFWS
ncbi:DUF1707 domain-containing protein [Streptomyces shenzhenensis]|uniref:DUF1707 SHOCT-like domain-containing protein n=1 Tax=Streptomyces shenzhenensis TaxID=943815 RepID=UPI003675F115